jgi:SNF2 family DNA or RNA helicase
MKTYVPHSYQQHATDRILAQPSVGLFLEMGMGKTVATLTAIDELLYNEFQIFKAIVIAPLRVAEMTWDGEAEKWAHLQHLTFSKVLGDTKTRKAGSNT